VPLPPPDDHGAFGDELILALTVNESKRFVGVASMSKPTAVRQIAPSPPMSEVPPTTTMAIASSEIYRPYPLGRALAGR
jgi:hypothetical protein